MALKQPNGTRTASGPNRMFSGVATVYGGHRFENLAVTGSLLNFSAGEAAVSGQTDHAAIPNGALPPVSWVLPRKSGGMVSRTGRIVGSGGVSSANGALGFNLDSDLTGSGDITYASGALVMYAVAALVGAGTVTTAQLTAIGNTIAALSGQGDITASGQLAQVLLAVAALSGSGDLDGAGQLVQGLAAVAAMVGSGDLSGAAGALVGLSATLAGSGAAGGTASALGALSADFVLTGSLLDTSNVGAAVWGAIAAANNDAGSMGEQMNNAGAGGNPWDTVIESGYTAEEVLRILLAVSAGKTTVTDLGGGAATVAFRDQADTKDRVAVDMQDSDRESVTLDPS